MTASGQPRETALEDAVPPRRGLVLVAEQAGPIADLQHLYLSREGYGVRVEGDGRGALVAARTLRPVAVVCEVRLPELDGIDLYRALRAGGDRTPVIFVTGEAEEVARVLTLGLGSQDYLNKPFSPRDLIARVRGKVEVGDRRPHPYGVHRLGQLTMDTTSRAVTTAGRRIGLTTTEFDLLAFLVSHPGRVYTREQLLGAVWDAGAVASVRTVDVHVAQVRAKLGDDCPIRTVRGVGYVVDSLDSGVGT